MFGKAPDVAKALKIDNPARFEWSSMWVTSTANQPLKCQFADPKPVTSNVGFNAYRTPQGGGCYTHRPCGKEVNGIWVDIWYFKPVNDKPVAQEFPDEVGIKAWLTEVAGHVK